MPRDRESAAACRSWSSAPCREKRARRRAAGFRETPRLPDEGRQSVDRRHDRPAVANRLRRRARCGLRARHSPRRRPPRRRCRTAWCWRSAVRSRSCGKCLAPRTISRSLMRPVTWSSPLRMNPRSPVRSHRSLEPSTQSPNVPTSRAADSSNPALRSRLRPESLRPHVSRRRAVTRRRRPGRVATSRLTANAWRAGGHRRRPLACRCCWCPTGPRSLHEERGFGQPVARPKRRSVEPGACVGRRERPHGVVPYRFRSVVCGAATRCRSSVCAVGLRHAVHRQVVGEIGPAASGRLVCRDGPQPSHRALKECPRRHEIRRAAAERGLEDPLDQAHVVCNRQPGYRYARRPRVLRDGMPHPGCGGGCRASPSRPWGRAVEPEVY